MSPFRLGLIFGAILAPASVVAARDSASTSLPAFGDALVVLGADIRRAEIDEAEYLAFTSRISAGTDTAGALHRAANLFKENQRIPADVLVQLPSTFASSDAYPPGKRTRYLRRFGAELQRSLAFEVDVATGIVASAYQIVSTDDASGQPWAANERMSRETALGLFKNYLILHGLDPDRLRLTARHYGNGYAIILTHDTIEPEILPSLSTRYFLLAGLAQAPIRKDIARVRLEVVAASLLPAQRRDRDSVMRAYLALSPEVTELVRSNRDIQKYRSRPLDRDLAALIRPPFDFTDPRDPTTLVRVFYSYQQIGGVVRRHRMTFNADEPTSITDAVLATDIGAASHYR